MGRQVTVLPLARRPLRDGPVPDARLSHAA